MCTSTCSGRCHFYSAFVIFLLLSVVTQGQVQKQCAAFNEYCQNHWDCCSNSCMSYLYRCTRNYGAIYPYSFFGISSYPLEGTLEDIIAQNFGNSIQTQPNQQQRPFGFNNRFSDIEMGQTEVEHSTTTDSPTTTTTTTKSTPAATKKSTTTASNTTEKIASSTIIKISTDETTATESTSTERSESKSVITIASVNLREAVTTPEQQRAASAKAAIEVTTTTTTKAYVEKTTTAATGACKEIGAKCYSNDECCTQRCHGFLHQCVT